MDNPNGSNSLFDLLNAVSLRIDLSVFDPKVLRQKLWMVCHGHSDIRQDHLLRYNEDLVPSGKGSDAKPHVLWFMSREEGEAYLREQIANKSLDIWHFLRPIEVQEIFRSFDNPHLGDLDIVVRLKDDDVKISNVDFVNELRNFIDTKAKHALLDVIARYEAGETLTSQNVDPIIFQIAIVGACFQTTLVHFEKGRAVQTVQFNLVDMPSEDVTRSRGEESSWFGFLLGDLTVETVRDFIEKHPDRRLSKLEFAAFLNHAFDAQSPFGINVEGLPYIDVELFKVLYAIFIEQNVIKVGGADLGSLHTGYVSPMHLPDYVSILERNNWIDKLEIKFGYDEEHNFRVAFVLTPATKEFTLVSRLAKFKKDMDSIFKDCLVGLSDEYKRQINAAPLNGEGSMTTTSRELDVLGIGLAIGELPGAGSPVWS